MSDGGILIPDSTAKKILVVAEESDCRFFLCNLLRSVGLESVAASNMTEGLQMAAAKQPILIILDVMMSNKKGIKMYHHLKHDVRLRKIPVIMLSAIDRETFYFYKKSHSLQHDITIPAPEAYLEKPVEAEEFIRIVRALIAPEKTNKIVLFTDRTEAT